MGKPNEKEAEPAAAAEPVPDHTQVLHPQPVPDIRMRAPEVAPAPGQARLRGAGPLPPQPWPALGGAAGRIPPRPVLAPIALLPPLTTCAGLAGGDRLPSGQPQVRCAKELCPACLSSAREPRRQLPFRTHLASTSRSVC